MTVYQSQDHVIDRSARSSVKRHNMMTRMPGAPSKEQNVITCMGVRVFVYISKCKSKWDVERM